MRVQALILANSRKLQHSCIAGIDLGSGCWIRPVSRKTKCGEVTREEQLIDGQIPRPMDLVEMEIEPCLPEHLPEYFSMEDRGLEPTPWRRLSTAIQVLDLRNYCSKNHNILHSSIGFVRTGFLQQLPPSERRTLELHEVRDFEVAATVDSLSGKFRCRASFATAWGGHISGMPVTDPWLYQAVKDNPEFKPPSHGFICASLALPLPDQSCDPQASKRYKLVASWIPVPNVATSCEISEQRPALSEGQIALLKQWAQLSLEEIRQKLIALGIPPEMVEVWTSVRWGHGVFVRTDYSLVPYSHFIELDPFYEHIDIVNDILDKYNVELPGVIRVDADGKKATQSRPIYSAGLIYGAPGYDLIDGDQRPF